MLKYYDSGSSSDSVELMISILVRYPEINTIKTDPKAGEIIFSFLLKKSLTKDEIDKLEWVLKNNIETFLFIQNRQPDVIRCQLQSYDGYSFFELIRDFKTMSQREISLLIQVVKNELGGYLLTENNDNQESEELEIQEEIIDDLLDRLQFDNDDQDDLIGYREAGRVMVFQRTGIS